MRVNPNNPINLFAANPAASKTKFAHMANETGARPELGSTKTSSEIPAARPLAIDLTTLDSDPVSTTTTEETAPAKPDQKFVIPEGATLLGLISQWGKSDSKYDFTQDGQVNMADMKVMLANWRPSFGEQTPEQPADPSSDPADVDTIAPAATTLAPSAEIPSTQPPVQPTDSLPIDSDVTEPVPPSPTETSAPPSAPIEPTDPNTGSQPTMLGLIGAWGQNNSTYDLNFDGTVNMGDLLMMLNNGPSPAGLSPESVQDTFENNEPARRNVKSASANGKLQQLAEQISTRLTAEGFGDQPPMNIRELVAQLNLSPKQTDFMMKQMQAKYPKGLGVSMVA
jgi:hypothetical protein